jgi:hypothetical protein
MSTPTCPTKFIQTATEWFQTDDFDFTSSQQLNIAATFKNASTSTISSLTDLQAWVYTNVEDPDHPGNYKLISLRGDNVTLQYSPNQGIKIGGTFDLKATVKYGHLDRSSLMSVAIRPEGAPLGQYNPSKLNTLATTFTCE